MQIEIDVDSAVPPYEQLRAQVTDLVRGGILEEGARLPSIRQLAGDLGVAPGTVARAYRELEADGLVRSRVRHGTTVAAVPRPAAKESRDRLAAAARGLALEARAAGVDRASAVAALDAALAELAPDPLA